MELCVLVRVASWTPLLRWEGGRIVIFFLCGCHDLIDRHMLVIHGYRVRRAGNPDM